MKRWSHFAGFTGVLLVVCICIIYVYATQTARRLIFNGFWLTHKLIVVMYILTILHGASCIVQKPMFFVYFIGPAIIFTVDKMISMSRKKTELNVIRAEKLPSGMITRIGVRVSNCWVVVLGCGVYEWWTVWLVAAKIWLAVGTVALVCWVEASVCIMNCMSVGT